MFKTILAVAVAMAMQVNLGDFGFDAVGPCICPDGSIGDPGVGNCTPQPSECTWIEALYGLC